MTTVRYELEDIQKAIRLTSSAEGKALAMIEFNKYVDSREEASREEDPIWAVTLYLAEDLSEKHLVIRGKSREKVHDLVRNSAIMWAYAGINIEPIEGTIYVFKE